MRAAMAVPWIVMVGIGLRQALLGNTWVGIALVTMGVVSTALSIRVFLRQLRTPDHSAFGSAGELVPERFDYIVWVAIAVPAALIVVVLGVLFGGNT